jgi:hypothetical protein
LLAVAHDCWLLGYAELGETPQANTIFTDGFNIYCGPSVSLMDEEGVERLSQYIMRAPISQEGITYISENASEDGIARVVYVSLIFLQRHSARTGYGSFHRYALVCRFLFYYSVFIF